ncbi:MAG: SpoIIE family protein phosphatase, partial [Bacteroidota bacterium]
MPHRSHVEIDCPQKSHFEERICGDVFLSGKVKEENRVVLVLSDGMGHGVKANILATLTATMALKFTEEHKAPEKTAEIIMNTLPECSQRKISYATFTVIDINLNGITTILEYDNPNALIFRDGKPFVPEWNCILLNSDRNSGKEIKVCNFRHHRGDRIIFTSDGITQSGLGTKEYPFGWGLENVSDYIEGILKNNKHISARQLASRILNIANRNDNYHMRDDASVGSVFFREARKLLICTGPPYHQEDDKKLAAVVRDFDGKKIVMGATTGDILSRELGLKIQDKFDFQDTELPPVAYMEGIDLMTEGILTLAKVEDILREYHPNTELGYGPADLILKMVRE